MSSAAVTYFPTRARTRLLAQVLELPKIMLDRDESFFDQGGHSLRAAKLAAKLSATLGKPFHVRALFDNPTIGQYAATTCR